VGSSSQYCEQVVISNGPPIASFNPVLTNDPTIFFDENSQNNPTSWSWDFGDGNSSTMQDPTHTYNFADDYNVCLIASNQYGSDTTCNMVSINNQLPIPLFDYDVQANNIVSFDNQTAAGNPPQTFYTWYFGTGNDSSNAVNPSHVYPKPGGIFEVCLKASNAIGTAPLYCVDLELENLVVGMNEALLEGYALMPNPASDQVQIQIPTDRTLQSVRIFSVDGKLIATQMDRLEGNLHLDLSALQSGIYFLELEESTGAIKKLPLVVQ
jgi:hypothetical protein